jgi:hypothetical protein
MSQIIADFFQFLFLAANERPESRKQFPTNNLCESAKSAVNIAQPCGDVRAL